MASLKCPTLRAARPALALLAGSLFFAPPGYALAATNLSSGGVFGVVGKQYTSFRLVPHWSNLLTRYRDEQRRDARCRNGGQGAKCPYTEWMGMLNRLKSSDRRTQVREVNAFANRWRYTTDRRNWQKEDYWETPGEFFARSGDCEDYAIVKFMSLRALGFDNSELRLVAVTDLNLRVGHAITLVDVYGEILILDNQIKRVVDATSVKHYKPVYSVNEDSWWLYR